MVGDRAVTTAFLARERFSVIAVSSPTPASSLVTSIILWWTPIGDSVHRSRFDALTERVFLIEQIAALAGHLIRSPYFKRYPRISASLLQVVEAFFLV